jgi:hypothetical protein
MTDNTKNIWVFPTSSIRRLWKPLLLYLQKKTGLRGLLVVQTEQDRRFYKAQFNQEIDDAQIVLAPDIYGLIARSSEKEFADILSEAVVFEKTHDISFMRDMVLADRHLGRGYMPAWNGSPQSYTADLGNRENTIAVCVESFRFYSDLFETHPPALALSFNGGTGIAGKPISLLCRRAGIPFRSLQSGRIGDTFYWADDEFENSHDLETGYKNFRELSPEEISSAHEGVKPPQITKVLHERKLHLPSLTRTAKDFVYAILEHYYARMRGFKAANTGYKPFSKAMGALRMYHSANMLEKAPFLKLENIPQDVKIVYFPLQFEPEISIQGQAPECADQLSVLSQIALSLPSDALLVVKEHPFQGGRRPYRIYRQILQMPNAVIVRTSENSRAIIERAALICAITSTVAYEGAIIGKPVAYFSRHGPIRAIRHVHIINSFEDMAWIRKTLSDTGLETLKIRQHDGAQYFHMLGEHCMDLGSFDLFTRNTEPTDLELELVSAPLLRCLSRHTSVNTCAT